MANSCRTAFRFKMMSSRSQRQQQAGSASDKHSGGAEVSPLVEQPTGSACDNGSDYEPGPEEHETANMDQEVEDDAPAPTSAKKGAAKGKGSKGAHGSKRGRPAKEVPWHARVEKGGSIYGLARKALSLYKDQMGPLLE